MLWLFVCVFCVAQHAMVLFNTLPMEKWVPIEADIQLLQDWLLGHHPDTVQCQLARRTLAQINWCIVTTVRDIDMHSFAAAR